MYVSILYRATYLIVHPTVFSNGFSEGQLRDIDRGFPPDSHPYTEEYDYLSDSDLEGGVLSLQGGGRGTSR